MMLGGEWFEEMFGHPDAVNKDTIKQTALAELKSHLGITKEPIHAVSMIHKVSFPPWMLAEAVCSVDSWSVVQNCFPLYKVNHSVKLGKLCALVVIAYDLAFFKQISYLNMLQKNSCLWPLLACFIMESASMTVFLILCNHLLAYLAHSTLCVCRNHSLYSFK